MSEMIQVPDGWEVKALNNYTKLITKGTTPTTYGFNFHDNGINFIKAESIDEFGNIDVAGIQFIDEETNHFLKRSQLKQGDLLFSIAGVLGRVTILKKEDLPANTNQALAIIRLKENSERYLYYFLQSQFILSQIKSLNVQMAQANLSLENLNNFQIIIPKEKKEQEKIAKILSTLDNNIEATNRLIEKEKNIKKAMMQELLTNGIDKDGHIRTRATHTYKESELGLIPDEWEVDKMNDVTKLMTDFVANGSFESLANNVTVHENPDFAYYVRLVDIRKGLGHEKQTYVDEQSFNFLKKSSLIGKEILIANIGANVGETFLMQILNKPATIAPNMIVIKVNNKIISEFLFYFLTYHKGVAELQNVTEGSGQPKINKTKLKTINVLIPKIQEQEEIVKILTTQDKKIETEETNLAKLKELKKGLMNDLLSGKVRVKI